jgi:hypothetical protein
MKWMVKYFWHCEKQWLKWREDIGDDGEGAGLWCYASKQAGLWSAFAKSAMVWFRVEVPELQLDE